MSVWKLLVIKGAAIVLSIAGYVAGQRPESADESHNDATLIV